MDAFLQILLIIAAFLSVIPVVNLSKNRDDQKYRCLKFLIFTAAFWTILIFAERTVTNLSVVYYANMLGYPLKYLLAVLMLCTIYQYIEKHIPKWILGLLFAIFVFEVVIAFTNNTTEWLLDLTIANMQSFDDLYTADHGPLFLVHLVLSYATLLFSIIVMFTFLAKNRGIRQYKAITRTMAISVFIVLAINLMEFLFIESNVDLTYISLIVVSHTLYNVIYRQDMVFNLRASGRGEILTNMREIYVLADRDKRIVEISPMLLEKYQIEEKQIIGKRFEELTEKLSDKVVLYREHNVDEDDETKDHYHLREKEFKLKGMDDVGYMMLLYDETQVFNLLRELNKLSNFDTMTGLNNRNYIEHKLEKITDTSSVGILSLDLNGLKINNDYLGHERGDYLLKALANHIKSVFQDMKDKDMARIGGDEFLVILRNTDEKTVEKKKQAILDICSDEAIEQCISVSIGTSFSKDGLENIYQLIRKADEAMYLMKSETSKAYKKAMIEYIKLQDKFIR